jgi:hypothetical protein
MTPHNRSLATTLVELIDRFANDETSVSDMQSRLQSAMVLFDREPTSPERAVRIAEADLEEILFTMIRDEQRPAAIFRLDELRTYLAETLATSG